MKELPKTAAKLQVGYNDDVYGDFEITDESTVKEIVEILLNESYVRRAKSGEPAAGNNGSLTVVGADGSEYKLSLHMLSSGGYDYTSETNKLMQKFYDAGMEYGALKTR